jgi:hypothetical protein
MHEDCLYKGIDPETVAAKDEDLDLIVLFAEALDPNNPKTVEDVEAEWKAVFG